LGVATAVFEKIADLRDCRKKFGPVLEKEHIMSFAKMPLLSFLLLLGVQSLVIRQPVFALTCKEVFLQGVGAQTPQKRRQGSEIWPESRIAIAARKVAIKKIGEEFHYLVDNTIYDNKVVDFESSGMSADQWSMLPLENRFRNRITGNETGIATIGSHRRQALQFKARAGERVFVVFESPESDRAQFDMFYDAHNHAYRFGAREFKFVEAITNEDGTISTLDRNISLIGQQSSDQGRIQAVIRVGDLVEVVFEHPDLESNRRGYWEWAGDPRARQFPYMPHRTLREDKLNYGGVLHSDGSVISADHPPLSLARTQTQGRNLQAVTVPGQQRFLRGEQARHGMLPPINGRPQSQ